MTQTSLIPVHRHLKVGWPKQEPYHVHRCRVRIIVGTPSGCPTMRLLAEYAMPESYQHSICLCLGLVELSPLPDPPFLLLLRSSSRFYLLCSSLFFLFFFINVFLFFYFALCCSSFLFVLLSFLFPFLLPLLSPLFCFHIIHYHRFRIHVLFDSLLLSLPPVLSLHFL